MGMEWNWLGSILYGLVGGVFAFLPISADTHQVLAMQLFGVPGVPGGISLGIHMGGALAVAVSFYSYMGRLRREQRIASIPSRRRKRQPDMATLMEIRLLKVAVIPAMLSCVAAPFLRELVSLRWAMALVTGVNALIILLPRYTRTANKDSRTLSGLDALLVGLSGILGAVPGISRVGMMTTVGSVRGADRSFALNFTYLLSLPVLLGLSVGEICLLLSGVGTGIGLLSGLLAFLAAFGAGLVGIRFMQFLAVRVGYSSFSYYGAGLSMLIFVLYLIS
jgi:undecaprenyl-diphosphatase